MRLVIIALALLAFPVTAASAGVPNMTCKAKGPGVTGMQDGPRLLQSSDDASHVFRIANGKVYIRHSSRDEYFYNDIKEVELGRYVSGHMVFVLDYDNRQGGLLLPLIPVTRPPRAVLRDRGPDLLSLADARKRARRMMLDLHDGIDPRAGRARAATLMKMSGSFSASWRAIEALPRRLCQFDSLRAVRRASAACLSLPASTSAGVAPHWCAPRDRTQPVS